MPWAVAALAVALALAAGCARERSRVVESDDERAEERDYRSMLDRARSRQTAAQALAAIEEGIQRFQFDLARLPTNLYELVAQGYLKDLATPPPGQAYSYDPVHGNVRLVSVADDPGVSLPDGLTNENRARLIEVNLPPPE